MEFNFNNELLGFLEKLLSFFPNRKLPNSLITDDYLLHNELYEYLSDRCDKKLCSSVIVFNNVLSNFDVDVRKLIIMKFLLKYTETKLSQIFHSSQSSINRKSKIIICDISSDFYFEMKKHLKS